MNRAWMFLVAAGAAVMLGSSSLALAQQEVQPESQQETQQEETCAVVVAPCPSVWGEVESLFWQRCPRLKEQSIVVDDGDGAALLSDGDIGFGFDPGLRADFGIRCGDCWALEFGYLALFEASARDDVRATDPGMIVALPGNLGLASNVFYGADQIGLRYSSQLYSGEINFSHCCYECYGDCNPLSMRSLEYFVGFRYLYLGEDLDLLGARTEVGGTETGVYGVDVDNRLYGAQIGGRMRNHAGCRFGWEVLGKVGLFGNDARQAQSVVDYPSFYLRRPTGNSEGHVAFVSEIGLSAIYQLDPVWSVKAGYSVMWIEGVALAPDQLDFSFTSTSGSQLETGGLFLHGVNVGLEARW